MSAKTESEPAAAINVLLSPSGLDYTGFSNMTLCRCLSESLSEKIILQFFVYSGSNLPGGGFLPLC